MFDPGPPAEPICDGVEIELRGHKLIIAPNNIYAAKKGAKARSVFREVQAGRIESDSEEAIDAATTIATLALARNYPSITKEHLENELSMDELGQIVEALSKANMGEARALARTRAVTVRELTSDMATTPLTGTNLQ